MSTGADATKQCPYCAELILAQAIKCKHCGEFLEPGHTGAAHVCPTCGASAADARALYLHRSNAHDDSETLEVADPQRGGGFLDRLDRLAGQSEEASKRRAERKVAKARRGSKVRVRLSDVAETREGGGHVCPKCGGVQFKGGIISPDYVKCVGCGTKFKRGTGRR